MVLNNAIDFYTSDGTAAGVFPTNAVHGMSINGGTDGFSLERAASVPASVSPKAEKVKRLEAENKAMKDFLCSKHADALSVRSERRKVLASNLVIHVRGPLLEAYG
ncbi:MAG TPA: hypothetical protein VNJ01_15150 [Bacteriovoracaceae bacterium]|nr:hypothetical protein [Bacteriovoracaceae bacterium]